MAGKVIQGGTGLCKLTFDTQMIEKSELIEDDVSNTTSNTGQQFKNLTESSMFDELMTQEIDTYVAT